MEAIAHVCVLPYARTTGSTLVHAPVPKMCGCALSAEYCLLQTRPILLLAKWLRAKLYTWRSTRPTVHSMLSVWEVNNDIQ